MSGRVWIVLRLTENEGNAWCREMRRAFHSHAEAWEWVRANRATSDTYVVAHVNGISGDDKTFDEWTELYSV